FSVSQFFTLVLLIISLSDTIYGLFIGEGYAVTYTSPAIKFVTFLLLGALILLNRTRGLRTSGCIFLFVSLLALCGAPQYRTELTASLTRGFTIDYSFVSYMVYYPCVISLLILNFFADAAPTFSEYPVTENPSPEYRASFPSKLIFAWFDRMAWLGYRKPLENKDLWNLNHEDTSKEIVPLFDKHWNESLRKAARSQQTTPGTQAAYLKNSSNIDIAANGSTRPPQDTSKKPPAQASIVGALCKTFGPTFLFGSSLKLIQDLLTFVSPQILSWLIEFVNEPNAPLWKGYFYAILLLVTSVVQTLLLSTYFDRMFRVGMRMRSALISTIYRKALTISNNARKETTVGEIVNLMSVDAQRMDITPYLNMLWSAPLQIGLALYFLWGILGPSVLAGLAVMVILIPVNGYVATRIRNLQIKQMKSKDARVKLMNEVLSGIKVLKLYAWELSFQEQILKIRSKEIKVLKEAAYLNAATSFIWSCAPFLVSLVSFAVYLLSDDSHVLDAQIAFVSLSLFNILRFPLSMLPMLISQLVQASVSVKRINSFMNQEDLDPNAVTHDPDEKDPLVIENGTFTWERNTEGEGAESPPTLQNINMRVREGTLVAIVGSVGAGKSSLVSALCGEMDKISGRVNTKGSIAFVPQQAWIQNATLRDNIVFGKTHVPRRYNKVIDACALTPDFEMLPAGDSTEIGEKGINLSGGQKQRVSLARAVYNDADMYFLDDPLSAVDSHVGKHIFDNVIGPKGILKNKVKWQVYLHYLKSIGLPLSMAAILLNIAFQGFAIGSNIWLSVWSEDKSTIVNGTQDVGKRDLYLGVYGALGLGQVLSVLTSSICVAEGSLLASSVLHEFLLTRVFSAVIQFFDTTPQGRIISRFSKDVDILDNAIPFCIKSWLLCLFGVCVQPDACFSCGI
ncbi:multidrug resistance-associated protein 1, partial [Diaphorina citri]|uniref:Multidrug resistance-associated protein 1 n=1 Tax=Diaphorina citri TaxID=121845 RepID=A0A3Q0IYR1_DIACI